MELKEYMAPEMEVILVKMESMILAGSNEEGDAGDDAGDMNGGTGW
ncbi:MAG: hypothetical protein IJ588_01455 [Prevotella sp.]|nr:hypothetical protein [Prevotella sp.]